MLIKKKLVNFSFIFDLSGALFISEINTLVISDLHLGKSFSFAKVGNFLPPYDINETIESVRRLIEKYSPKQIISLGDNFHEPKTLKMIDQIIIKKINETFNQLDMIWIDGNHDGNLKNKNLIYGKFKKNYTFSNLTFTHIKSRKLENNLFEFSGHFHPKISFKHNRINYLSKCFVLGKNFCILPAFGSFTGGLDINSSELKKILPEDKTVIAIGKKRLIEI
tara:strand:- start:402 stop:1067 length:666 start_codon:yes stop_codon:yes gene_type:complete